MLSRDNEEGGDLSRCEHVAYENAINGLTSAWA